MYYWLTFGQYLCFMQVFMPYWKFEYTQRLTCNPVLVKMGGDIGQDPTTEVTHRGERQQPKSGEA